MRRFVIFALLAVGLLPATAAIGQTTAEKATARRISSYLEQSGQLRNYRIGVMYQDGVAMLSGEVASAEQRDTAIRLAEQVAGVSQVNCQLQCANLPAAPSRGERRGLAGAFEEATPASAQSGPSGVMQAYGGNQPPRMAPPQQQRSPMMTRTAPPNRARQMPRGNMPLPAPPVGAGVRQASTHGYHPGGEPYPDGYCGPGMGPGMGPCGPGMDMQGGMPAGFVPHAHARGPSYESAHLPGHAWPSYAAYPNYAALSYPKQYSPTAWPYIGPFYPYPQVPLAWRKVALEWDDGWWFLDFSAHNSTR